MWWLSTRLAAALVAGSGVLAGAPARATTLGSWSFDEGTGSTVADGTGNGHTGTLQGAAVPTFVTGNPSSGSALHFNGANQVGTAGAAGLQPATLVVEADMRAGSSLPDWRYLVAKPFDGSWGSYALVTYQSGVIFQVYLTANSYLSPTATAVWDNAWHRLRGTFDGSTVRLFVDGVEVGTGTSTTGAGAIRYNAADGLVIGAYGAEGYGIGGLGFTGDLDNVQVGDYQAAVPEPGALGLVVVLALTWSSRRAVRSPAADS